jgi:hypothetical protein
MEKSYLPFYFFALFVGSLLGFSVGTFDAREAVTECQKELPRNVECRIIAVPIDKN